jgi:hypothetical protein
MHAHFESDDDVATVTAPREQAEHRAWRSHPADTQPARSSSARQKSAPFGTVQVAVSNTHTEITIDLFTSTCLPLNFPMYPGAKFGGQNMEVEGTRVCHIVFVSNDRIAAVTAFYERELNSGNWQVTSSAAGHVDFRLRNGKMTVAHGTIAIAVSGDRTEIKVDAYS